MNIHNFHIPVMGLAFTIDTPIRVAKYGISSVISIGDDTLIEQMRKHYLKENHLPYFPIHKKDPDYRAKRITAYLDLVDWIVKNQVKTLKEAPFVPGSDITRYFQLLPEKSPLKKSYRLMLEIKDPFIKTNLQKILRDKILPGSIDVNIMTKLDKPNVDRSGRLLPPEYSDALSALRGFAKSVLSTSVVFSAGLNPRLFTYMETFGDFFPDDKGKLKKKIVLKVSDFRSAVVQGKILAKKGLWVSEFRIESGLNCGGHAFATEGLLLGPILEEFKKQREELRNELQGIFIKGLVEKGIAIPEDPLPIDITVQGGIGTASENDFLLEYYQVQKTGWGTPFLLVPEATNVDDKTLQKLAEAGKDDLYLSEVSPLGVPMNVLKSASASVERRERIAKGEPGSPCIKKHLTFNTEFTTEPICTASSEYQKLKIEELHQKGLDDVLFSKAYAKITEKECLCVGLSNTALNNFGMVKKEKPVSICPGPNLAWFSGIYSLEEMVGHIYGRLNLLNKTYRPHMFVNELNLYIDHLNNRIANDLTELSVKGLKSMNTFKENLLLGIEYYVGLVEKLYEPIDAKNTMKRELDDAKERILGLVF